MGDRTGQQLGNYSLVKFLGQGGSAEVYLGEHLHLGTSAAIKILPTQLVGDESQRFLKEARMLATLEHQAIIKVKDCGIENDIPFLVMDYAPHGTLRQRHPRGSRVPFQVVLTYAQQVASALQYAHAHQIVHRDVKPENMLIGANQNVLLSDFGIAVVLSASMSQHSKVVAGTACYMAPEQILSRPQPASDQYALAVIIYEWLCGVPPFQGSFLELTAKHLHAPPPSCRTIDPTFPQAVEQVLFKALAKAPEQRFASVQEFTTALTQSTSFPSATGSFAMAHPATSTYPRPVSPTQAPIAPPYGPLSYPSGASNPFEPTALSAQPPSINSEDMLRKSYAPGQPGLGGYYPVGPTYVPPKKRHTGLWIGLVLVALLLVGGGLGAFFLLHGSADPGDPKATLQRFCDDAIRGDFQDAYQINADNSKKLLTEEQYVNFMQSAFGPHQGVASCQVSNVQVNGTSATGVITVTLGDGLTVSETDSLIQQNGTWKVDFSRPNT